MAFTSWNNLYKSMLDALSSNSWMEQSFSYGGGKSGGGAGREVTFRSIDELIKAIDFVKTQAQIESGQFIGRRSMGGCGI